MVGHVCNETAASVSTCPAHDLNRLGDQPLFGVVPTGHQAGRILEGAAREGISLSTIPGGKMRTVYGDTSDNAPIQGYPAAYFTVTLPPATRKGYYGSPAASTT